MNTQNIKEKLLKEKAAKEKTITQCQNRIKDRKIFGDDVDD